ncbi:MAG: thermonuclease family protein [Clostridia bacterium]|nr:thermonuclease family protein [Clostridia bacterium]
MKNIFKLFVLIMALLMLAGCFTACGDNANTDTDTSSDTTDTSSDSGTSQKPDEDKTFVDFASTVKFNPGSGRAYAEVTVRTFVDGDTTHFNINSTTFEGSILKARYLGVNTPESTGQIEPWGKKASNYTKNALKNATSIIVESDDSKWNPDSTGDRYLVWVWYKGEGDTDYHCLNLELLQQGLALASKSSATAYGDVCTNIYNQAVSHKLHVFSKEKDPDFYYGAAYPVTLKELKTNIENYRDKSVSFEGVVVRDSNQTVYIEEYDEETGLYFGIQVYYGFNLNYFGQEILTVGNRVLIVGNVQYYETGGTYQISDITCNPMRPDDPESIKLISEGHKGAYAEVGVKDLLDGKVSIDVTKVDEEGNESIETKTFDRGFITMHASASLKNLTIKRIYTTNNEDSKNHGALSITCEDEDGNEIILRTIVLKDENGKTITADKFPIGKVIDAKGVVDVFDGEYQLKVFSANDIIFK